MQLDSLRALRFNHFFLEKQSRWERARVSSSELLEMTNMGQGRVYFKNTTKRRFKMMGGGIRVTGQVLKSSISWENIATFNRGGLKEPEASFSWIYTALLEKITFSPGSWRILPLIKEKKQQFRSTEQKNKQKKKTLKLTYNPERLADRSCSVIPLYA